MVSITSTRYGERISFIVMIAGIAFFAIVAGRFAVRIVYGANPFAMQFPIAELGNCGSMDECRSYCDDPANGEACASYAESRGLASKKEVAQARSLGAGGPGGCRGAEACKTYCDDPAHGEECLSFAEQNGFISKEEAGQARTMMNKTGPGGCRGEVCRQYCEDPAHADECIAFAEKEGFMTKEQAEQARKHKELINEPGPGGCKGEGECRNYCDDPAHMEECLDFGVKKGFMNAEEAARIRKISGSGPGGCKGRRECDAYCRTPEHGEECLAFAEENGLIPKEDAERARKMMNKTGPGGCRGEECRNYCDDSSHQDECIDFAVKEGMMPPEEAERAKKFAKATEAGGPGGCKGHNECGKYCGDPAHGEECFAFAKTNGMIPPEEERRFEQSRGLNQKIQENGGPGGCKNEGECMQYCGDPNHVNECFDFAEKSGMMSREDAAQGLERFNEHREFSERVRAAGPEQFRPGAPAGFEGGPGGFGPGDPDGSGFMPGPGGPGFGSGPGSGGFGRGPIGPASFGGAGGLEAREFAGPSGCASPEECVDFCAKPENRGACVDIFRRGMNPQPQNEARPPEFRGPAGCRGFEECGAYCADPNHADECSRFNSPPAGEPPKPPEGQSGVMPRGEFMPPQPGTPPMPPQGIPPSPCNTPEECKAQEEQFRGHPGEFPGRSGEFPGGEGFGAGGQPGMRGIPFDGKAPRPDASAEQPRGFMEEFKGKAERGEIQEGRFMQGGRPGGIGPGLPTGQVGAPPRPIAPPADMAPREFMRRVEDGKAPMPRRGEFVRPDTGVRVTPGSPIDGGVPSDGGSVPPPPIPRNFEGFSPADRLAPMPVTAPMSPAPMGDGGFVPPPMPRETFAPMPQPTGQTDVAAPAPAPMPLPTGQAGVPTMEAAPPPPPPPPPTSQLKSQSFIGLLYEAVREIIAR